LALTIGQEEEALVVIIMVVQRSLVVPVVVVREGRERILHPMIQTEYTHGRVFQQVQGAAMVHRIQVVVGRVAIPDTVVPGALVLRYWYFRLKPYIPLFYLFVNLQPY
jgi:hypothetical protein